MKLSDIASSASSYKYMGGNSPADTGFNPNSKYGVFSQYGGDKKAGAHALQDLTATREQTYQDTYASTAMGLRDTALGTNVNLGERLAATGEAAGRQFDMGAGAVDRQQRAMGVDATGNQGKRMSLRRILSEVDARNVDTESLRKQQQDAQDYAIQTQADLYNQQSGIYGDIAAREAKRRGDKSMAAAGQKQSAMGAAGMAVGIAAMFM